MGTRFQHKIVGCAVALAGSRRQMPMVNKYKDQATLTMRLFGKP